jgi:hypothetical protein
VQQGWCEARLVCSRFGVQQVWCAAGLVCSRFGVPRVWCAEDLVSRRTGPAGGEQIQRECRNKQTVTDSIGGIRKYGDHGKCGLKVLMEPADNEDWKWA